MSHRSAAEASVGFDAFDLHPSVLRGVVAAGFQAPRPIQAEAIPEAIAGRDVLGLAQTGTGKTAAFMLPILDWLVREPDPGPRVLVLAPTRELATQIAAETRVLAKFTRLTTVTIYGGVSQRGQEAQLRKRPEIVVGCPGRVLDLVQQGVLNLDGIDTLVLDEADHMFDMGFLRDIRKIMDHVPVDRQTMLFSATMPREIRGLADEILLRPHVVELADSAPAATIDHALIPVDEGRKRDLLERLLTDADCTSAIVFTRTKHRAKRLALQLAREGHRAVGLQGNLSQSQRDRAMSGFRSRKFNVLVATDIVARGIDVSGVSHVINFDAPNTPEAYTHRIGRTGRAEMEGVALTFVTNEDADWVRATERVIGKRIPERPMQGFEPTLRTLPAVDRSRAAAPSRSGGNRSRNRSRGRSRRAG
ncbi:MAG TPA: DEAD/DEAH box helicase [Candidatus Krumholzibacteria bacterium]|nr:DEAD/DEAH box helicase [Candidatus Krumholzibacteria bacterium]